MKSILTNNKDFLVLPMLITIILIIMLSARLLPAIPTEQRQKIERDIDIMEKILDKLIVKDSPFYFTSLESVTGLYLEGFGVLFDLKSIGVFGSAEGLWQSVKGLTDLYFETPEGDLSKQSVTRMRAARDTQDLRQEKERYKQKIKSAIDETIALLHTFFLEYANPSLLKPTDRVCVSIRVSPRFVFEPAGAEDKTPRLLRSSVLVSDLDQYRKGKISEAEMKKKIRTEVVTGSQSDKSIDIMSNIIDSALEPERRSGYFPGLDGKTQGLYLADFGAVFITSMTVRDNPRHYSRERRHERTESTESLLETLENLKQTLKQDLNLINKTGDPKKVTVVIGKDTTVYWVGDSTGDRPVLPIPPIPVPLPDWPVLSVISESLTPAQMDSIIGVLRSNLADILGQYGATLKTIKPEENILIAISLDTGWLRKSTQWIYVKVKKSDIDKFSRGQLDETKFRARIETWKS